MANDKILAIMKPFFIFLATLALVNGFPNGAPSQACHTMTPQHSGIKFDGSSGLLKAQLQGSTINVTMSSHVAFKGFIIQGRDNGDNILGSFNPDPNGIYQLMKCNGVEGSSITHVNPQSKNVVSGLWNIPDDFNGDVIFKATIVYRYNKGQKFQVAPTFRIQNNIP